MTAIVEVTVEVYVSDANSPGLTWIKSHKTTLLFVCHKKLHLTTSAGIQIFTINFYKTPAR